MSNWAPALSAYVLHVSSSCAWVLVGHVAYTCAGSNLDSLALHHHLLAVRLDARQRIQLRLEHGRALVTIRLSVERKLKNELSLAIR